MKVLATPKDASEYVRKKAIKLLNRRKIYDIGAYGWKGYDDFDPKYSGHAMWQTDGPADEIFEPPLLGEKTFDLPRWRKDASILGADFEGLMKAARLSIGLALFQHELVSERIDAEESLFHTQVISSMMTLGAASDRLRDFFVVAAFRITPRNYKPKNSNTHPHIAPFTEAATLKPATERTDSLLRELGKDAKKVAVLRKFRNTIVHEVATEIGLRQRELMKSLPKRILDSDYEDYEKLTQENLDFATKYSRETEAAKIKKFLTQPINWYRLLIDMSNRVFIYENEARRYRTD